MKDLFTILVAGILLWWVMIWPMDTHAEVIFADNKVMVWVKVFSF
jgi:hypothetical protein